MDKMLREVQEVKYVIKVDGRVVSAQFASQQIAEANISSLSIEQQPLAEVVAVTTDGKEILFG